MATLMACGHTAQGIDGAGRPVCVICVQIDPRAEQPVEPPDLIGRVARCSYCKYEEPSALDLPFFEYRPNQATDTYYCGCRGWD